VKEDFLLEDNDLNVYQNTRKSDLYSITSRSTLMQYNDAK